MFQPRLASPPLLQLSFSPISLKIFLHVELFKGIIIFIDEFEEVFSGSSPTYQAQYAQDLRNLFDSLSRGVMFVVATARLQNDFSRFRLHSSVGLGTGVEIAPISDETTALVYAQAYMKWDEIGLQKK